MIDETLLLEISDNQGWSFPLTYPLVLDSKLAKDKIQEYLRLTQYINQDGKCLCQRDLDDNYELHHALITRKDAINLPEPEIIHNSYNTVLLHPNCHRRAVRAVCLIYLVNTFGFEAAQRWYLSVKRQMKGEFRNVRGLFTG